MERNFLLTSELAADLYETYAADLPVIDYHNHLSVTDILENRRFENLYDLWIAPDPYKHRAMRMCGVPERLITGEASPEEKFAAWCDIFPRLAGNPLYHWSLMELEDVLEIREIPDKETCKSIWQHAQSYMERNKVCAGSILEQYHVEYLSPCVSLLEDPAACRKESKVKPSLRGDTILDPDCMFLKRLEEMTKIKITDLESYFQAVERRLDVFAAEGCRFADHSLDDGFRYLAEDGTSADCFLRLLRRIRREEVGTKEEQTEEQRTGVQQIGEQQNGEREKYELREQQVTKSAILRRLGSEYAKRGMVLQLHMGARRHTSTRLRQCAGPAGGYAAVGNSVDIASLTRFLDDLEQSQAGLPRVILFALNPADHGMIAALAGSYTKDHVAGLVTQGPAWWWCDHGHGIRSVLENTAVYGLLANFPGMTTDSRSFLSFVRHDYFRRILCSWLAERIRTQDLPKSPKILESLVYDMCYGNAKKMIL